MLQRNFLIWFIVSLFYAYQYILRVIPNIVAPELIMKFKVSIADVGQFSGIYYIGYTIAHIPIGIFLDKLGLKLVFPICIILTVIGTLPLVCSENWYYTVFGRVIIGIGSSASAIGIFKVASTYFSQEKSAKMTSLSIIIGVLGAIYGGSPLNFLLHKFGWNYIIYIFLSIGCIIAFTLYFVAKQDDDVEIEKNQDNSNLLKNLQTILLNRNIILISIFGGLMVGPLEGFADGWAKTFLSQVYEITEDLASSLSSLVFIGMAIGGLFLAFLLEKYPNKHYEIIISCSFIMTISFILLFMQYIGLYIVIPALLATGFASGYQIIVIYKAISYVPTYLIGLCTAVSNMIIMVFGYFFHVLIAKVIDIYWDGTIIDGTPIYSTLLLIKAMSIIPICLILGTFGFIFLLKNNVKN